MRFAEYLDYADRLGFEEVILAVPMGPDPFQAVELVARQLVPHVLGRGGQHSTERSAGGRVPMRRAPAAVTATVSAQVMRSPR